MKNDEQSVSLADYDKDKHDPGANIIVRGLWYLLSIAIFDSYLLPVSKLKAAILRLFGAKVGRGLVIKPRVRIKYPWFLKLGDDVWIGEGAWIDNLSSVNIGNNVCISQDAYILTGNHDYKDVRFGLIVQDVTVRDGAWLGARSVVCPGVDVNKNALLMVGSVLTQNAEENGIYRGNPATLVRKRIFRSEHR